MARLPRGRSARGWAGGFHDYLAIELKRRDFDLVGKAGASKSLLRKRHGCGLVERLRVETPSRGTRNSRPFMYHTLGHEAVAEFLERHGFPPVLPYGTSVTEMKMFPRWREMGATDEFPMLPVGGDAVPIANAWLAILDEFVLAQSVIEPSLDWLQNRIDQFSPPYNLSHPALHILRGKPQEALRLCLEFKDPSEIPLRGRPLPIKNATYYEDLERMAKLAAGC